MNRYAITSGKEMEFNPVAWQVHGCVKEENVERRNGREMGMKKKQREGVGKGNGLSELLNESVNESMKGENKQNFSLNTSSTNKSLTNSMNDSSSESLNTSSNDSSNDSSNTRLNDSLNESSNDSSNTSSNDGWVCDLLDERSDALWQGGTHTLQFSMNTHAASYQRYRLDFCTPLLSLKPLTSSRQFARNLDR